MRRFQNLAGHTPSLALSLPLLHLIALSKYGSKHLKWAHRIRSRWVDTVTEEVHHRLSLPQACLPGGSNELFW